jgi:steroid 5-alpha reductase family enzyme
MVGFVFEAVGDWQLSRFRADPANEGAVMDRGLWRYTRHPNYFGDAVVWWGLYLFALHSWCAALTIIGPVIMTWLLAKAPESRCWRRTSCPAGPAVPSTCSARAGSFPCLRGVA